MTTSPDTSQRPCGLCQRPVLRSDFQSGRAKQLQGILYCVECTTEVERARLETAAFKQSLSQGGAYACGTCRGPIPVTDIQAGAAIHYDGQLSCRPCSANLLTVLARRRRTQTPGALPPDLGIPGAPITASQRMRAAPPPAPAAMPPAMPVRGASGRAPAPPPSARLAATTPCVACDTPVSAADIAQGRGSAHAGQTFCGPCAASIQGVLGRSSEEMRALTEFTCGGCGGRVTAEDLLTDRAVRSRGEIYCGTCKKDFGRSSIERSGGSMKRPAAGTVLPEVTCARCEKKIRSADVRAGKAHDLGGRLHCEPCKQALDEAAALVRKKAALRCAHCERAISQAEVQKGKITSHAGNVLCSRCGGDPAIVLRGKASGSTPAGACPVCGDAAGPGGGPCGPCATALAMAQEASMQTSMELAQVSLGVPCDGCKATVTAEDLEAGRAGVHKGKTLCATCAARAKGKAGACPTCNGPLDAKRACPRCADAESQAKVEVEEWSALSAEMVVHCGRCKVVVMPADISQGKAKSADGVLLCPTCAPRATTRTQVRACPICDAPLGKAVHPYGGRIFCLPCKPVLEQTIAACAVKAEGACKLCKAPAQGRNALQIGADRYCAGCRKKADLLLLMAARDARARDRRRSARPNLPVAAAVAGALSLVVITGIAAARSSPEPGPVATTTAAAPPLVPLAREAFERALRAGSIAPASFDDVARRVAIVEQERAAIAEDPSLLPALDLLVAKVRAAQADFAAPMAARALDEAQRLARAGQLAQALERLAAFPPELLASPAGQQVESARRRLAAQDACERRGADLLRAATSPGGRVAASQIEALLGSADAQTCDLRATETGKRLEAEASRLRNRERLAPPPAANGQTPADPDALFTAGLDAERKGDLAAAGKRFDEALAVRGEHVGALCGAARVALQRDPWSKAARLAERALRLAPGDPAAQTLAAWFDWPEDDAGVDRARAALASIGQLPDAASSGGLGKRLAALLAAPPPTATGRHVRVHSRGVSEAELGALVATADDLATRAAVAFGLGEDGARVVILLLDDAGRAALTQGGLPPGPGGRLAGTLAVAPASAADAPRAVVAALAARARDLPAWLAAVAPDALCGPPSQDGGRLLPLADVEGLKPDALTGDARRTALSYAAMARTTGGARAVASYIASRHDRPTQARADLEAALRERRR